MTGTEKLRLLHLEVYKSVLSGLVSRLPFGVEIDEELATTMAEEAELVTDAAMFKLKPVVLSVSATRKSVKEDVPEEEDDEEYV